MNNNNNNNNNNNKLNKIEIIRESDKKQTLNITIFGELFNTIGI